MGREAARSGRFSQCQEPPWSHFLMFTFYTSGLCYFRMFWHVLVQVFLFFGTVFCDNCPFSTTPLNMIEPLKCPPSFLSMTSTPCVFCWGWWVMLLQGKLWKIFDPWCGFSLKLQGALEITISLRRCCVQPAHLWKGNGIWLPPSSLSLKIFWKDVCKNFWSMWVLFRCKLMQFWWCECEIEDAKTLQSGREMDINNVRNAIWTNQNCFKQSFSFWCENETLNISPNKQTKRPRWKVSSWLVAVVWMFWRINEFMTSLRCGPWMSMYHQPQTTVDWVWELFGQWVHPKYDSHCNIWVSLCGMKIN